MNASRPRFLTSAFVLLTFFYSLFFVACTYAQTQIQTETTIQESSPAFTKPVLRIALVLGGGGARGAAHIGVLEILEREHISLACVVGTSMGGLVAGGYAAGLSPADMRAKLDKADWTDIFLDSADYTHLSFRKKRVTKRFLSGTELGLTKRGLQLKPGVIAGNKIKLFFNFLVGSDYGDRTIEHMPIPLAIVATDIGTGEKFIFDKGNLPLAMRASMSVPGFMTPVDYQGHKLVDGGLVDNLPIKVARDLCHPDIIIAVDVSSKLKPAEQLGSLISVTSQMIDILGKQNVAHSVATLTPADILIVPALGDFSATNFAHFQQAADIGRRATEQQTEKLQNLSVDSLSYNTWRNQNKFKSTDPIQIDQITIAPLKRQSPEYITQRIHQKLHNPLNRIQLEQDLINLYGDGFYESVDYHVNQQNNKNILTINARERAWSSDYFTLGFDINNEYRLNTSFDLRAAYRSTWINHYGGEIFSSVSLGSNPGFEVEFYQPINYRQTYFVQPSYAHKTEIFNIFRNNEKIAEYDLTRSYSELAFGRNLGLLGQAKLGWREYDMKGVSDIDAVNLDTYREKFGGLLFDVNIDNRNRLHFPSRGWSSHISYFDSEHEGYAKLSSEFNFAYPLNDFILAGRATYTRSTHGTLPITDAAYLGGFLNLSAYASNQIIADEALYAHLRGEQIIGRMPLGFNGDLRLGIGFEGARLKAPYELYDEKNGWLNSAVLYLGGETPLGPAYLGVGFSDDGKFNLYMQVGAH